MSRSGNCYDNAVAESFFGTLKTELVNRQRYRTRAAARSSLFEWIECWYNRRRRHSSLGYLSPEAFEAQNNLTRAHQTWGRSSRGPHGTSENVPECAGMFHACEMTKRTHFVLRRAQVSAGLGIEIDYKSR